MFSVSEGNTVKRMEDIFWKTEKKSYLRTQ